MERKPETTQLTPLVVFIAGLVMAVPLLCLVLVMLTAPLLFPDPPPGPTRMGELPDRDYGTGGDPLFPYYAEEWTFDGEAGETVTIQAQSEGCQVRVLVYGPDNVLAVRSGRGLDHQVRVTAAQTGTYRVVIDLNYCADVTYQVRVMRGS